MIYVEKVSDKERKRGRIGNRKIFNSNQPPVVWVDRMNLFCFSKGTKSETIQSILQKMTCSLCFAEFCSAHFAAFNSASTITKHIYIYVYLYVQRCVVHVLSCMHMCLCLCVCYARCWPMVFFLADRTNREHK